MERVGMGYWIHVGNGLYGSVREGEEGKKGTYEKEGGLWERTRVFNS